MSGIYEINDTLVFLSTGVREGTLWKKGKDNGHFQKRKFVLSLNDFTLKYFAKEDVRDMLCVLQLA